MEHLDIEFAADVPWSDTILPREDRWYSSYDEIDAAVAALTSVIGPVLVIVMGIVIGGMVAGPAGAVDRREEG